MIKYGFVLVFSVFFAVFIFNVKGEESTNELDISLLKLVDGDCSFDGIELKGKVKFVDNFADIKIKYVDQFPDIKIKFVTNFPDDCGEWKVVDNFPDFTVKVVEHFPDLLVKKVDYFPGVD